MRAKQLALRVLSTAAMLSIVTSIASPAFAAVYYINDGSVDISVSESGEVTVRQNGVEFTDSNDSVIIRGGSRGDETDDRVRKSAADTLQADTDEEQPVVLEEPEAPETTEAPEAETPEDTPAEEPEADAPEGEQPEEAVTPAQPEETPEEPAAEAPAADPEPEAKAAPEEKTEPAESVKEPEATAEPAAKQAEAPVAEPEEHTPEQEQTEEAATTPEPVSPAATQETRAAAPAVQTTYPAPTTGSDIPAPSTPVTSNVITIVNNWVNDLKKAFSFTLDNVNIAAYDNAPLTVKGDGNTDIELDGNNVLKADGSSGYHGYSGLEKSIAYGTGTLTLKDDKKAEDGTVGTLTAIGDYDAAGIGGKYISGYIRSPENGTSNITITGGKVMAIGGHDGAGIGGACFGQADNIQITGTADVTAISDDGAGIGGGYSGSNSTVSISQNANVTAVSVRGAAIGGGQESGADVTISGNANVFAEVAEGYGASAIGGGRNTSGSSSKLDTTVCIQDNATVTAIGCGGAPTIGSYGGKKISIEITGGTINAVNRPSQTQSEYDITKDQYPAIGSLYNPNISLIVNSETGKTVINAFTTSKNNPVIGNVEWVNGGLSIGTVDEQLQYNDDHSSKFGEDNSVIVNLFRTAKTEETDTTYYIKNYGLLTLHKILGGNLVQALHNQKWLTENGYTSEWADNNTHAWHKTGSQEATLEEEGYIDYVCSVPGCNETHHITLPKLEPEPEPTPDPEPVTPEPEPTPDPEPEPQPEPQPEPAPAPAPDPEPQPEPQPEPTPAPAPAPDPEPTPEPASAPAEQNDVVAPRLYVVDPIGIQVLFDQVREDTTLRYTANFDSASLMGGFDALEALAEEGVETIVFHTSGINTPGAESSVSVSALLNHGGSCLKLTHDGTEVHLTIDGQNADELLAPQ